MTSYPSSACRTSPSRKTGNPWRWPVFKIRWCCRWRQTECEDCLARAESRHVRMYLWPPIWTPCLRKEITLPGRRIVKQKEKKGKGHADRGKTGRGKDKAGGHTLNGCNRETGVRNWCYTCSSGYHFAPQFPQKGARPSGPLPYQRARKETSNQPYSPIAMEPSLQVQPSNLGGQADTHRRNGRTYPSGRAIGYGSEEWAANSFLCMMT